MSQTNDGNFQQQLHSLKDRVNALTLQYSPKPVHAMPAAPTVPSAPPPMDRFTAQLQDVKAHLSAMQASFAQYQAKMHRQSAAGPLWSLNGEMAAQNRLTLPSGPLFWQLFNSLRADFRGLDTRVSGLEHDVDALEDRVDRLEPDRFTPPASITSQDDHGAAHNPLQAAASFLNASKDISELYTEVPVVQAGQPHSRVSSLQYHADDVFGPQSSPNARWHEGLPQLCATRTLESDIPHGHTPPQSASKIASVHPEGVAFRDREIDRMDDQLRAVQDSLRSSEELAATKDSTMNDMRAEIETLRAEAASSAAALDERNNAIRRLNQKFGQRETSLLGRIEMDRHEHEQAIADRDAAVRAWQQRCDQEAAAHARSVNQRDRECKRANDLIRKLEENWAGRRDDLEQAHRYYEGDLAKLNEFVEQKAGIIAKQEEVMAKGATLLQQRDAEIDRLQRRLRVADGDIDKGAQLLEERDVELDELQKCLRVAEDDKKNEQRQQKRMARLLDETQHELEHLKSLSGPQHAADLPVQQHDAVMAASVEAVDGRDGLEIPGSYPREARRAHDQQRETQPRSPIVDGINGAEAEAVRTGSPKPRRLRRHDSSRYLQDHVAERRHYRQARRNAGRSSQDRINHRESFDANDVPTTEEKPALPDRRRARFLEDGTIYHSPPLPAPVGSTRKMASEADLRHANAGDTRRSLSKHQSMQELPSSPRQWLQPYVETEGESDGEKEMQHQQNAF